MVSALLLTVSSVVIVSLRGQDSARKCINAPSPNRKQRRCNARLTGLGPLQLNLFQCETILTGVRTLQLPRARRTWQID